MEKPMRPRLIWTAAMLMIGTPAIGQTDKPDPSRNAPASRHPGPLVLAFAQTARSPAPAPQQPALLPKKRVEPRVTTCRCGDPEVEADPDAQDR
jgi:hypothetical protein